MICIIRIAGEIGLSKKIKETLDRLRLKKKYSCVVLENPNDLQLGMIKTVIDFVAFGEINDETYKKLKEARGKIVAGKLKPFFRLHPPRKGIDSKKHFGETRKGVLGNNKEKINELVLRML
ncbi:MAG TPA: uL30 family ribosomal protein [Candidatus Nanoarchaeia archaeon]|nr:uL30 family ribosomal protein [Candidatus Nanoarchaeia archaeon]